MTLRKAVNVHLLRMIGMALLAAAPLLSQPLTIQTSSLPPGSAGVGYGVYMVATGGTPPYYWSGSGALPTGLLVTSNGMLTGTPVSTGTYTFTVAVMDSRQAMVSRQFSVTIAPRAVSIITSTLLPATVVGQAYSQILTAAGGTPPYQWRAGNGLPAGLAVDANTGTIAGTPTASGSFHFQIQVVDAAQATATGTFDLTVNSPPLAITTVAPLFAGIVGAAYAQTFSASGGKPPYVWSVVAGGTGDLVLDPGSGILRGTPQGAGTFNFTVQVADSAGNRVAQAFSVIVSPPALMITAGSGLPPGNVGSSYSHKLPVIATGGTPPYNWSLAGSGLAVPGLHFDPDGLTISGIPEAAGNFNFTVQVKDSGGLTAVKALSISIAAAALSITTSRELPDAALNSAYTLIFTAAGGVAPYTWSANGLPDGVVMNSATGVITGVPSAAGVFPVAISVTDNALTRFSDRFQLNVNLPPPPPVSISGLPDTVPPAQQFPVEISLGSSFPAPISGQAVLTFSAESGATDKTVQFSSGGTIANFSIPAGSTTIVSDVPLAIQTGTVSGTITVSLRLQAGGIDITAIPAPALSARIDRGAPVITDVQVIRSGDTINIAVSGYSTAREVTQATFTFSATSGQTLQSSSITVPVESLFGSWFQDPANGQYGSQFVFKQTFSVQGDSKAVIPQAVTLTNRVGQQTFNALHE